MMHRRSTDTVFDCSVFALFLVWLFSPLHFITCPFVPPSPSLWEVLEPGKELLKEWINYGNKLILCQMVTWQLLVISSAWIPICFQWAFPAHLYWAVVSNKSHSAVCFQGANCNWCDICMVSRKHTNQTISHTFPGDLELLINSASNSKECWRKKTNLFWIVICNVRGTESPLDQKQPYTLHLSYNFNSQNVLKLLERPVNWKFLQYAKKRLQSPKFP